MRTLPIDELQGRVRGDVISSEDGFSTFSAAALLASGGIER